jgi:hypothetical protein
MHNKRINSNNWRPFKDLMMVALLIRDDFQIEPKYNPKFIPYALKIKRSHCKYDFNYLEIPKQN